MKTFFILAPLLLLQSFAWSQALQVKGDIALKNMHSGLSLSAHAIDTSGYTLTNPGTGKTLQPGRGKLKAGIMLEEQSAGAAQSYELIPAEGGQCWVRVKGTDLYLTPTKTGVELQPWKEGDAQRWKFVAH